MARVRPLIRIPFLANHPSPCPHPQSESLPATLHIALIKLFTTPMHVGLEEIFVSGTGSSFLTLGRKEKCSFSKNPLLLIVRLMLFQPERYCRNFSNSTFFGYFFSRLDMALALEVRLRIMRVQCGYAHMGLHVI